MSDEHSENKSPFGVEGIRQLTELMEEHDLREIRLKQGDAYCVLRRGVEAPVITAGHAPAYAPPPAAPPLPAGGAAPPSDAPPEDDGLVDIVSPTVGTFYEAPSPDDPPFVKPGDSVKADTVVCIVEAMKVFNQIPADVSGTIVSVLVKTGDPVEFGQPMFKVRPS